MRILAPVIVVVILVGVFAIALNSVKINPTESSVLTTPSPTLKPMNDSSPTPTPSTTPSTVTELKVEDIVVGTGAEAVVGKHVTVNYSGTLTNGTKFDSSYDRGIPFDFDLGAGRVIKGWDQGVVGMKVGGKRKLTIPASLGYGSAGAPPSIPGGATLVFEVELLKVE
ncbi:hypothetical protein BH10PAT1_BH10PAT1_0680 [soil metagenome]